MTLWPRLSTSSVVMASTSLLLLLTLSPVLKSQVLSRLYTACGRVVGVFRLVQFQTLPFLFDAILVESVLLV